MIEVTLEWIGPQFSERRRVWGKWVFKLCLNYVVAYLSLHADNYLPSHIPETVLISTKILCGLCQQIHICKAPTDQIDHFTQSAWEENLALIPTTSL